MSASDKKMLELPLHLESSQMLLPSDLRRLAELIKLGAETAKIFSESKADGETSRIMEASNRILAAAEDLMEAGRELEQKAIGDL